MEGQERSLLVLQNWINTISMQAELVTRSGHGTIQIPKKCEKNLKVHEGWLKRGLTGY